MAIGVVAANGYFRVTKSSGLVMTITSVSTLWIVRSHGRAAQLLGSKMTADWDEDDRE